MSIAVKVSPKGQVSIPAELRRELGIEPGDRLIPSIENGHLSYIKSMTLEELSAFATSLIPPGTQPVEDVDAYYQAHRGTDA